MNNEAFFVGSSVQMLFIGAAWVVMVRDVFVYGAKNNEIFSLSSLKNNLPFPFYYQGCLI
tara:strand:+ start:167 stop:346 length:180 start_codon:yes stop_codon:yes gene_type:complete